MVSSVNPYHKTSLPTWGTQQRAGRRTTHAVLITLVICLLVGLCWNFGFYTQQWRLCQSIQLKSYKHSMHPQLSSSTVTRTTSRPSDFGNDPYGINPWLARLEPDCMYYGEKDGLFKPSTPHPRYIVTGGAGFIGSRLVKALAAVTGPGQVKVVDSFATGRMANLQHSNGSWSVHPQRDVCFLDLRSKEHATKFIRGADYVYHLAGIRPGVSTDSGQQLSPLHNNALMNINALAASKANGVSNYIYVGAAGASPPHLHMDGPGPAAFWTNAGTVSNAVHHVGERQRLAGQCEAELAYTWSNLMGEQEAQFAQSSEFNVGIVRLQSVYGPGDWLSNSSHSGVVARVMRQAMAYPTAPFVLPASWEQHHDFVYVHDVVRALLLVHSKGMNKGPIEIGSGASTSLKQLLDATVSMLKDTTSTPIEFVVRSDASIPGCFQNVSAAALGQARSVLGWQPTTSLQQGLAETYRWTVNTTKNPSVLVVIFGQPRGGDLAWKSLHKHVLKPLNAHLALYTTLAFRNNTLLERMAQYVWKHPEYRQGWDILMDMAEAQCPKRDTGSNWRQLCSFDGIWGGGLVSCPNMTSMSSINLGYRWMISQKIMAFNLHKQYDYIIYTRADHLHLCDHWPLGSLDKSRLWVPMGEEYWGYTDRHLVHLGPELLRAINTTQELVCNPSKYMPLVHRKIHNFESLQATVWNQTGMLVGQFSRSMFVVVSEGDPTSSLQPFSHPELEPFGLKLKYGLELGLALSTCHGVNITSELKLLTQYEVADLQT